MKKLIVQLILILPIAVFAQNNPQAYRGMSEADMQRMQEQAQKAQLCMQDVDMSAVKALEPRARQMESEVKALCAQGERSAAQDKAIDFSREIASDPSLQKMRECGEMLEGMMPQISFIGDDDAESSDSHVCDEM